MAMQTYDKSPALFANKLFTPAELVAAGGIKGVLPGVYQLQALGVFTNINNVSGFYLRVDLTITTHAG